MHNITLVGSLDKNLAKIDALLVSWRSRLPESKRDLPYRDGKIDEMMFQAFMICHAISILLHQPHSQLDPSVTRNINACAPNTPARSSEAFNVHTRRTIQAANELSALIEHRVSLLTHTHFFGYMITLASTVHLSEWSLAFMSRNDDNLRQRIRLCIGGLLQYSDVWPAAEHLASQVKVIAQEVYRSKKGF
jgi:hypothetical protein